MNHKRKIGAVLVEQGLINRHQLERALQTQLMAGGHLGTSLIELGFIDEDGLAQALGRALNLRHATREVIENVASDVLGLLDAQTVERYRAIPLGRGFRSLHVAVITPRDVASLSARTAHRVIPWIAPEISVLEAMERYYSIPRPRRFLILSDNRRRGQTQDQASLPPALSPLEQAAIHASVPTPVGGGVTIAGASAAQGHDLPNVDISPLAHELAGAPAAREVESADPLRWSFEEVSGLLSNADSREELAGVVLDYAIQHMPGCVLFGVRDAAAYVWDWRGMQLSPGRVSGLEFPIGQGSLFHLLRGEPYYQGPVPSNPQYLEMLDALERPHPEEVLLLPVHLNDRLIAVLYGEGTVERPIAADIEDYLHLVSKVSMALNIIVLKMKIRVG